MGGGDLNLKKSWHPATFRNQERVWKEEQKASEEAKKLAQLQKELAEERQMQELEELQVNAGLKKRSDRLDWMYAAPNQSSKPSGSEMEDFLLGKRRVDDLLRQKSNEKEQLSGSSDAFISQPMSNANTERDIANKIREDPLLTIKKREHESLKAILDNPLKLKEIREGGKKKKDKKNKEKNSKKERKSKDKQSKKVRRSRSRSRSISLSPDDLDHHKLVKYKLKTLDHGSHRQSGIKRKYSDESDASNDSFTHHRSSRHDQYSPSRRSHQRRSITPLSDHDHDHSRGRGRDQDHRQHQDSYRRVRSRSNSSSRGRIKRDRYRKNTHDRSHKSPVRLPATRRASDISRNSQHHRASPGPSHNSSADSLAAKLERERKLNDMMLNAQEMDEARKKRVTDILSMEKNEEETEMEIRMKRLKQGGAEDYLLETNRKRFNNAGNLDEALGRKKAFLEKGLLGD